MVGNKVDRKIAFGSYYGVWGRRQKGGRALLLTTETDHKSAVRSADSAVESYGFHSACVVSPRSKGGRVTYARYR